LNSNEIFNNLTIAQAPRLSMFFTRWNVLYQ